MLPTTLDEAIAVIRALPKRDLFHYLECKLKMDARLKLLSEGKPKKEKKRIVLKLDGLSDKLRKALKDEELL